MIRIYLECGERALALRHYERCCALIEAELGIAPTGETRALYAEIVPHVSPKGESNGSADGPPGSVLAAIRIVEQAMGDLERARERLRRAQAAVEAGSQSPVAGSGVPGP
jgi:DNA-binding SARP family transcriptional activator